MAYNLDMNQYGMERWVLDRHESVVRASEARARLARGESSVRLAGWLAVRLRLLADRLDPRLEPSHSATIRLVSKGPS